MSAWDSFLDRPRETTQYTENAHEYAKTKARARFGAPRFATDGTELRVLPDAQQYVAVILGQTHHMGMQGAHPDRIAYLRDGLDLPVWIAFIQGGKNVATVWSGWVPLLGDVNAISLDTAAKRWGWATSNPELKTAKQLDFPEAVPPLSHIPAGLF